MYHGQVSLITPGSIGPALHPILVALQRADRGLAIYHRFASE